MINQKVAKPKICPLPTYYDNRELRRCGAVGAFQRDVLIKPLPGEPTEAQFGVRFLKPNWMVCGWKKIKSVILFLMVITGSLWFINAS
jgi:hypothetical protein